MTKKHNFHSGVKGKKMLLYGSSQHIGRFVNSKHPRRIEKSAAPDAENIEDGKVEKKLIDLGI